MDEPAAVTPVTGLDADKLKPGIVAMLIAVTFRRNRCPQFRALFACKLQIVID
jgi:hypothetical protein